MSLDVELVGQDDYCVWEGNITHNLTKMANEAGLYQAMWCPVENGWSNAEAISGLLSDGIKELITFPNKYKKFNPENGWGSYDALLRFSVDYYIACINNPMCKIKISK